MTLTSIKTARLEAHKLLVIIVNLNVLVVCICSGVASNWGKKGNFNPSLISFGASQNVWTAVVVQIFKRPEQMHGNSVETWWGTHRSV